MRILVTRFHLLLLGVTLAMSGVGLLRIPVDFVFAAHWTGSTADWVWPRDVAMLVAPVLMIALMAMFFAIGRVLTANHYAKVQHILDPALTLALLVIASTQLGLLFTGIGSDLDFVRGTGLWLGAAMLVLGVVLFEAERHTYAGLRLPWPIKSDRTWRLAHRAAGVTSGLAGAGLLAAAWFDIGTGPLVLGFAAALLAPPIVAALATLLGRRL